MIDELQLSVDIGLIMKAGIRIQDFLFLTLVKNKQKELLAEYYSLFDKLVNKEDIQRLVQGGWLLMSVKDNYAFDNFKVGDDFLNLTTIKVEDAINDIKNVYPKQTPSGARKGLQADSNKWGPKYLSIIKKDRQLHEKIVKCIEAEKQHRRNRGQEEYWPLLLTYVNNKRWEVFMEEIDNFKKKEIVENTYEI